jgi:hypothetical protein
MGLSRMAGARRIFDLMRAGLVEVEGAAEISDDPLATMLENGLELVRQKQFDAASLVFNALLQVDPADRRVREFARMVEGEHLAALFHELPPLTILLLNNDPDALRGLRPEERQVARLLNGSWDVATVALASPSKELDTMKTLSRLVKMGIAQRV